MLADGLLKFNTGGLDPDVSLACGTITATYGRGFGLFDHICAPIVADTDRLPLAAHAFGAMLDEMRAPEMGHVHW